MRNGCKEQPKIAMVTPEDQSFDPISPIINVAEQEEQRLKILTEWGLLNTNEIPVFEKATQTTSDFLEIPICIVSVLDQDRQWIKASVGLLDLLPFDPQKPPQLPREESFCSRVVETAQLVSIRDTATHPNFNHRLLVQQYGVRAYLGVPLLTSTGECIGTLAVMDLAPRTFTAKEIQFVETTAQWIISELERHQLLSQLHTTRLAQACPHLSDCPRQSVQMIFEQIQGELLTHLTQALRTPLTSVLGMASVLCREIYGPLTPKQQEYLEIIHNSGRHLLSQVDEILAIKELERTGYDLCLSAVDLEMFCQQVINALEQEVQRKEQELRLSIEPGHRLWILDKFKVQQLLYHLIFCVIQSATAGSTVRVHISRKLPGLNIAVWVSHPWLGEGLPLAALSSCPISDMALPLASGSSDTSTQLSKTELLVKSSQNLLLDEADLASSPIEEFEQFTSTQASKAYRSRESLGLLLSCLLAEMHGGDISIQGSSDAGYRYVISLPEFDK